MSEVTREQIEELADRLTGRGFNALTSADWPLLVLSLEALSAQYCEPSLPSKKEPGDV